MKITSQPITEHTLVLNDAELSLIYATMRKVVADTPLNDPHNMGREKLQDILQTIEDKD